MPEQTTKTTREVPSAALRFDFGRCEFGNTRTDNGKIPISLRARSGNPINHWFWGPVVHDISGMRVHKDSIPLDYAHDDQEVIGYADKFTPSDGGFDVSGYLVPFAEGDRANEVAYKSRNGVPYESSIFFADPVVEEVPAGKFATANGMTLLGPVAIVRNCDLRGIAICPYGADKNTPVQLSAGDRTIVTILKTEDVPMPVIDTPAVETPVEKLAEETPPEPVVEEKPEEVPVVDVPVEAQQQVAEDPRAEAKRFLAAFGSAGVEWYADGMTFDAAKDKYIERLTTERDGLAERLKAINRGESEPALFQSGDNAPHSPANGKPTAFGGNSKYSAIAEQLAAKTKRN